MGHTQAIICIITTAGLLGGLTNYLILYDFNHSSKEHKINLFKSILLGLSASITVPLFLQIIQTNLMEIPTGSVFPTKNYFVLFGFCVIVAIYSKRFLDNVYSKIENLDSKVSKAVQKAEEAKIKAAESEKKAESVQAEYYDREEVNAVKPKSSDSNKNIVPDSENTKFGHVDAQHTMLTVPTGKSFEDNLKYDIYYDPASRNHTTEFKFLGLYKYWTIRAIGEVKKVVYCDYDEKKEILICTGNRDIFNNLTSSETRKIIEVILKTKYYDLRQGNKFFLVDKFYETEYLVKYPIMGKQYLWLNEYFGFDKNMSAASLARLFSELKGDIQ